MEKVRIGAVGRRVRTVRKLMNTAGTRIGSVSFIKRETGKLRRIAYRLHCVPTYAPVPKGKGNTRKAINRKHNLITVLDVNQPLYNRKGHIIGRGAWKSIPLDTVVRIRAGGTIYKFV
jgi:hypothetical protein